MNFALSFHNEDIVEFAESRIYFSHQLHCGYQWSTSLNVYRQYSLPGGYKSGCGEKKFHALFGAHWQSADIFLSRSDLSRVSRPVDHWLKGLCEQCDFFHQITIESKLRSSGSDHVNALLSLPSGRLNENWVPERSGIYKITTAQQVTSTSNESSDHAPKKKCVKRYPPSQSAKRLELVDFQKSFLWAERLQVWTRRKLLQRWTWWWGYLINRNTLALLSLSTRWKIPGEFTVNVLLPVAGTCLRSIDR